MSAIVVVGVVAAAGSPVRAIAPVGGPPTARGRPAAACGRGDAGGIIRDAAFRGKREKRKPL